MVRDDDQGRAIGAPLTEQGGEGRTPLLIEPGASMVYFTGVQWWRSERLDVKRTSHGPIPFYYYTEDPTGYSFELLGGIFSLDHDAPSQTDDYRLLWIPL